MKRFITFFLLLIATKSHQAQPKIYFGAEVAWSADIFSHNDQFGYIKPAPLNSALWGINLRYMVLENLFVETGLYSRAYKLGIGFEDENYRITTDRTAIILPLRFGARIPFFKGAIVLSPVAGIALAMASEGEPFTYEGSTIVRGNQIDYEFTPQYAAQSFALAQVGAGIDFRLGKRALITANTNYYSGLSRIMIEHIKYKVNIDPERNATSVSSGSFYSLGIGFRYRL